MKRNVIFPEVDRSICKIVPGYDSQGSLWGNTIFGLEISLLRSFSSLHPGKKENLINLRRKAARSLYRNMETEQKSLIKLVLDRAEGGRSPSCLWPLVRLSPEPDIRVSF